MKKPKYTADSSIRCRRRGSHADAEKLVEYLVNAGGSTDKPAEEIARDLGWERRSGLTRTTDMERFHIARNHVRDNRDQHNLHCTGYDLHYRSSNRGARLMLVDPKGSPLDLLLAAAEEMQGDLFQQQSMRKVNGRRIQTAESMAVWAMALVPPDMQGYRLMTEYTVEIEKFGAISDNLIAEINAWIAGKTSGPHVSAPVGGGSPEE